MDGITPRRGLARALCAVAALVVVVGGAAGAAHGERNQKGNLIIRLGGGLSPLKLPRDRLAPVAVHLEGGLETADGALLPRVTRIELGLPAKGALSTRGLPICRPRQLRDAKPPEALAACRGALVGHGRLKAQVRVPNQDPFEIDARLLAFNGRVGGGRAVLLHGYAADPPTVVVLPFLLRQGSGRFGLSLVAKLPPALGPWPRLASFEMTLSRRYTYRGRSRSYLSASCPIPKRNTAGFFSFAHASMTLTGGRQIGVAITRGCRAR
jgi:hypothetical protein